jgi:DNA polymerase-1
VREVWAIDFEYVARPGKRPDPICCVALEVISGRRVRLWGRELRRCPFETGPDVLFVGYYVSAEISCFLQLGWPIPARLVDLYAEFSALTNGRTRPSGRSLLGALAAYGLSGIAPAEKAALRERIIAGPPYTSAEAADILTYCESDVDATAALLCSMEREIAATPTRFNQALLRGRYAIAVAHMEHTGVPMDVLIWDTLRSRWADISRSLIDEVDPAFGVYENGSFKAARFRAWTEAHHIPWPVLDTGAPDLEQDTFRTMAGIFPIVEPLRQLRASRADLRQCALAIGSDGRNRTLLSPFATKTGRNAPSSTKFVFGASSWLRHLVKPEPGTALAYLDFTAQEIAIAGALAKDTRLLEAALSGDPYLQFAKDAGLAPHDATKATHGALRQRLKAVVLGSGYGMEAESLSFRLQVSVPEARHLLRLHAETYPAFARWRFDNLNRALVGMPLATSFGWPFHVGPAVKPNTLRNWPVQSAGSEMLRLACANGVERGVAICAPVHDAVVIEAPLGRIEEAAQTMRGAMQDASRAVLDGVAVGVDAKIIRAPGRFVEERGARMWDVVMKLLGEEARHAVG